jgi:hypothetical protein
MLWFISYILHLVLFMRQGSPWIATSKVFYAYCSTYNVLYQIHAGSDLILFEQIKTLDYG